MGLQSAPYGSHRARAAGAGRGVPLGVGPYLPRDLTGAGDSRAGLGVAGGPRAPRYPRGARPTPKRWGRGEGIPRGLGALPG